MPSLGTRLGVLAVLAASVGCREKPRASTPATSVDVKPIVAEPTRAPPETPAPPSTTVEELAGIPTDGPFATLTAYCNWFKQDCTPNDARLCRCDVEGAGPN